MSTTNDINSYQLNSDDFEEIREADASWNYETAQLEPGPFQGKVIGLDVGPLEITYNRYGRRIHYRGMPREGAIAFIVSLNQSGQGIWVGEPVTENDIFIQGADKEAELFSPSFWECFVFVIPVWMLESHLSALNLERPDDILHTHRVHTPTSEQMLALRNAGKSILDTAATRTAHREYSPSLAKMADSLVETAALTLAEIQVMTSTAKTCKTPSCRRQTELIRKAQEYCFDRVDDTFRIGELCRELQVSERTLRHVFRERINMSPLDYLKKLKLNQVYKKLRASDHTEIMIKQIAFDHGFFHLGQFSRDYRNLFGELPSQTLTARRPSIIRKPKH